MTMGMTDDDDDDGIDDDDQKNFVRFAPDDEASLRSDLGPQFFRIFLVKKQVTTNTIFRFSCFLIPLVSHNDDSGLPYSLIIQPLLLEE